MTVGVEVALVVASEGDEKSVDSCVTSIGKFVGNGVVLNVKLLSAKVLNDDGSLLDFVTVGSFVDVMIKSE